MPPALAQRCDWEGLFGQGGERCSWRKRWRFRQGRLGVEARQVGVHNPLPLENPFGLIPPLVLSLTGIENDLAVDMRDFS
jgi:hypothetical protein